MKFYFVFLITGLLLLTGCQFNKDVSFPRVNTPKACSMEAKICPDGKAVGRTGPNCEFEPCAESPAEPFIPADNQNSGIVFPIKEFKERITKKSFGDYITPETSPIQPERFSGYHTGVDVEYGDSTIQIPVMAITAGEVVLAEWVSGYGGVAIIRHNINDKNYLIIYGHLNPDSLPEKNKIIKPGEQIGVLGAGYSHDTDNERKHLHVGVYTGLDLNLSGYVQTEEELIKWINPLILFP